MFDIHVEIRFSQDKIGDYFQEVILKRYSGGTLEKE